MAWQWIAVIICVALALVFAVYKLWQALHHTPDCDFTCAGCPLRQSCEPEKKKRK